MGNGHYDRIASMGQANYVTSVGNMGQVMRLQSMVTKLSDHQGNTQVPDAEGQQVLVVVTRDLHVYVFIYDSLLEWPPTSDGASSRFNGCTNSLVQGLHGFACKVKFTSPMCCTHCPCSTSNQRGCRAIGTITQHVYRCNSMPSIYEFPVF